MDGGGDADAEQVGELMTLKEFAEYHCINYQTAKTWLRRGRIVSEGEGFKIVPPKPGETVPVNLKPSESLKPYADALKPETVTIASQWADVTQPEGVTTVAGTRHWCGKLECEKCGPVIKDLTAPIEFPHYFRPPISDSAQDSHGSKGADLPPESNRESCVDAEAVRKWVLSGENFTIAELCALRAQIEALQRDSLALQERVLALEVKAESQESFADRIARALPAQLQAVDVPQLGRPKNGIIDPPSSGWGA